MHDPAKNLDIYAICQLIERVGKITLRHFSSRSYQVFTKKDNSPVTEADLEASRELASGLKALSPHLIIDEESVDLAALNPKELPENFWLLDPIDGTRDFIAGTGDYTVNVALIHSYYPIAGFIYAPYHRDLFYAIRGKGAYHQHNSGKWQSIQARSADSKQLTILVNRSAIERAIQSLRLSFPDCKIVRMGSSLKYCRLAQGCADLYVRYGPTHEWDTAAAQIILEEAGGALTNHKGTRVSYRKDGLRNESLMARGDPKLKISYPPDAK